MSNEILTELENRHRKTQELMLENGIDAILVLQDMDLLYYTNSMQVLAFYLPASGNALAFYKSAKSRIQADCPLDLIKIKSYKDIPDQIKNHNLPVPENLGIEYDVVPVSIYNKISRYFNENSKTEIVDSSVLIKKVRMVKSGYEISLMKKAAQITNKVFSKISEILKPGITELEVAMELEYLYRQNSHLGPTRMRSFNHELFFGHVLSGETSLVPASFATPFGGRGTHPAYSYGPSDKKIKENEPVVIDYVSNYNGYHVDTTRTFVIGQLDDFLYGKYEKLKEVYKEIKKQVKPGNICSDIYQTILKLVDAYNLNEMFMGLGNERVAFIGHGIGIEIDEFPVIAKGFDIKLEKNMAVAFEPKMFFSSHGAIGLEDTFLVDDKGCEVLAGIDIEVFHA